MCSRQSASLIRRSAWFGTAFVLTIAFFAGPAIDEASAHGGRYRDPVSGPPPPPPPDYVPAGQKPANGRIPKDPNGNPHPGGLTGTGGSSGGPTEPPKSEPTGGRGPNIGPRVPPAPSTGGGSARAGATTPGRSGRKSGGSGAAGWEVWWEHNQAPLLNLRERLAANSGISGSADWLLGSNKKDRAYASERPGRESVRRDVLPILERALEDSHFDVRAAAVIALGKTRIEEARPLLAGALADTHPQVAESAALALGVLGDPRDVALLVDLANDTTSARRACGRTQVPPRTRAFATIGLGLIGNPAAIEPLIAIVGAARRSAHLDLPVAAVTALGLIDDTRDEVRSHLMDTARDRGLADTLRSAAVIALGRTGDADLAIDLRGFLRDSSLAVRRSAVIALGEVASPDDRITAAMLTSVLRKGNDPLSRHWACIALGRGGSPHAEKALLETVHRAHGDQQSFGALGLALWALENDQRNRIGSVLHGQIRRMRDPGTRGAFAIGLGMLAYRDAEADLVKILEDRNPRLRGHVAMALGMMQAKTAVPALRALLDDSTRLPALQKNVAIALGLVGDRDAVATLAEVLETSRTEYVQSASASAIGFIGDASTVPLLGRLASARGKISDIARAHAIVALGVVADPGLLPALHVIAVDSNYRALVGALEELLTIS